MDAVFITDYDIIAARIHPSARSVIILSKQRTGKKLFELVERDLTTQAIYKTFTLPSDLNKYQHSYNGSAGFLLYYAAGQDQLYLAYPTHYLAIWDYHEATLLHNYSCRSGSLLFVNSLAVGPDGTLYFASMGTPFISVIKPYHKDPKSITIPPIKIKLSKKAYITDMTVHETSNILFASASDGMVHRYDPSSQTEFQPITYESGGGGESKKKGLLSLNLKLGGKPKQKDFFCCMEFDPSWSYLIVGTSDGYLMCYNCKNVRPGQVHTFLECTTRMSEHAVLSAKWIKNIENRGMGMRVIALTEDGLVKMFNYEERENKDIFQSSSRKASKSKKTHDYTASLTELCQLCRFSELKIEEITQYNLGLPSYLNLHQSSNILGIQWPVIRFARSQQVGNKVQRVPLFGFSFKLYALNDMFGVRKFPLYIHSKFKSYRQLIPDEEEIEDTEELVSSSIVPRFVYESHLFYIQRDTIRAYRMASATSEDYLDLSKELYKTNMYTKKFDMRPHGLVTTAYRRFLITQEVEGNTICSLMTIGCKEEVQTETVRQYFGAMGIFVGSKADPDGAIFVLNDDRTSATVVVMGTESDVGIESCTIDLQGKAKAAFWTPLRQGYGVLYDTDSDHSVRASLNCSKENPIGAFAIDKSLDIMSLEYDEFVVSIEWNCKEEDSSYLGAIVTNQKIYILSEDLQVLHSTNINDFSRSTSQVTGSFWFGETLLYTTQSHLRYLTKAGTKGVICTLENPFSFYPVSVTGSIYWKGR